MLQKLAVIGLCLGSLAPTVAHAAPPDKPKAHSSVNLESWKKALESGDEARALAALDEIELASERRAAPLVDALLVRGANSKLLLRAIGVAGALAAPSSSSALAPYVKHRAADVRGAAARSLSRTKGSVAVSALREALRGSDPAPAWHRGRGPGRARRQRGRARSVRGVAQRRARSGRRDRRAVPRGRVHALRRTAGQVAVRRHGKRLFAAAIAHRRGRARGRQAALDRAVAAHGHAKSQRALGHRARLLSRQRQSRRFERRSTPRYTVTRSRARAPNHELSPNHFLRWRRVRCGSSVAARPASTPTARASTPTGKTIPAPRSRRSSSACTRCRWSRTRASRSASAMPVWLAAASTESRAGPTRVARHRRRSSLGHW